MSLATLERAIVQDLKRKYPQLKKMKVKDLMEWSTSPIKAHDGETLFETDDPHTFCAVKNDAIIKLRARAK